MEASNIDDLLLGHKTNQHPQTPENQHLPENNEPVEIEADESEIQQDESQPEEQLEEEVIESSKEDDKKSLEIDEYGNEHDTKNEAIRERLARQARKHQAEIDALRAQLAEQGASREVQQAAHDFEYDPEAQGDWQQQLRQFVKQTVQSMNEEQQTQKSRADEAKLQREFEHKFHEDMGRFSDFVEVIDDLPFTITDAMTLATRSMANPASFLYAAAKRNPKELERISKIRDPYAQMTEMGKLEERMRLNKPSTKAPRPLGRTIDNASIPQAKKKREDTIEDLIAQSEKRKIARMNSRSGGIR